MPDNNSEVDTSSLDAVISGTAGDTSEDNLVDNAFDNSSVGDAPDDSSVDDIPDVSPMHSTPSDRAACRDNLAEETSGGSEVDIQTCERTKCVNAFLYCSCNL